MTLINSGFAQRVIEARAKAGMSQMELAAAAEIAPAQISRYEAGKVVPRIGVAYRLAAALKVDLDWLCDGTSELAFETAPASAAADPGPLAPALARMESLVTQRERELKDAVALVGPVLLKLSEKLEPKTAMPGDPSGRTVEWWRSIFEPVKGAIYPPHGTGDTLSQAITWARLQDAAAELVRPATFYGGGESIPVLDQRPRKLLREPMDMPEPRRARARLNKDDE